MQMASRTNALRRGQYLRALTADKISGKVDFENRDTGHKEMEVTFSINGASGCWAYGQYTVSVDVADASS